MKNILVIGTGTIGEPLIGLLADFRKELKIGNVFFHKRTPLKDEVAKVNSMTARGANLVVDKNKVEEFIELGHNPDLTYEAALEAADVIIDCTPAGNESKEKYYLPLIKSKKYDKKIFIAQGSEKGFGVPFAHGINDDILAEKTPQFIQVVSCNTHNICSLINTITPDINHLTYGDFTCIRRANDISQAGSFIASPEVGAHHESVFGTHHAKDAYDLFRTLHMCPNIFSSALKINSQYMHAIRFNMHVKPYSSNVDIVNLFKENKFTALTEKTLSNRVFSFGRDHGYYGRIFNHTVLSVPSLHIGRYRGNTTVTGFCFTPQDGNSILSSVAASLCAIHGKEYKEYMKIFDKFLFNYV